MRETGLTLCSYRRNNTDLCNKKLKTISVYIKPSSNAGFSIMDSIIRVKINANNYLPDAENSVISGLPNTL
jgi:hypothetical protein